MSALLLFGAVVVLMLVVPAIGVALRWIIRRPLTPRQIEQDEMLREPVISGGDAAFRCARPTR
jgi:hypothetical protein